MSKILLQFLFAFLVAAPLASLYAQLPPPCPNGVEPAEDCESACIACDFNGYMATTTGFLAGNVPSFCSMIQNDQWIGFIAGANSATFTILPSNCLNGNGVQVALYGGCGESFISCNGGSAGNGNVPTSITASLTPGTNYFLLIDGYSGDQCDLSITVSPPTAVGAQPLGPVGAISGPAVVCPGATVTYTVATVTNAGGYTWTVPAGATVNAQPSGTTFDAPDGHTVDVTFGNTGGQVCVHPANSCFDGTTVCKNVQVVPIPPTNLPKVIVCNEDTPYTLPWGTQVNTSGNYANTYESYQGCDSVVKQLVVIKPPIVTNQAAKVICQGSCVTVCGENFCQPGQVAKHCTTYQGCDSLVTFPLTVLNPVAEILGGSLLSCAADSTILRAAPAAPNSINIWKNLDGTVLASNADSIIVYQPGTITLTTTQALLGVSCSKSDTIIITENYSLPTVAAAASDTLACHQPTVQLLGSSNTPGATFKWSALNGFASTDMSPVVYEAGYYTLVVTHPVSHCTASATTQVLSESNLPLVLALSGSVTCADSTFTILTIAFGNLPITYSWDGPAGFTSSQPNPAVSVAGTYTVTITEGVTGCMAAAAVVVTDDRSAPSIVAVGDTITCVQSAALLSASTTGETPTFLWTGPGGFTSNQPQPTVSAAGIYTVTVTDGSNGCTATATALVVTNTLPPGATAIGGTLECDGAPVTLQGSSPTAGVTFLWTGPGTVSNLPDPTVTQPGSYTLVVTAPSGCTSTAHAVVGQLQIPVIGNVQLSNDQNGQGIGAISITITGSTLYSVLWILDGQTYATTQNLSNVNAGVYTAVVTSFDQCSDTISVIVDNIVATSEPAAATLWEVAPNPASSFLEVHFLGDALPEAHLSLFDLLGRKVLAENMTNSTKIQLGVKDLPAGQYQLLIGYGGQILLRPVVVQR